MVSSTQKAKNLLKIRRLSQCESRRLGNALWPELIDSFAAAKRESRRLRNALWPERIFGSQKPPKMRCA